jgi:hypothetical protein
MLNNEQKTCAHIPCRCVVPAGQTYCGQWCEEAGSEDVEIACECDHPPACPLYSHRRVGRLISKQQGLRGLPAKYQGDQVIRLDPAQRHCEDAESNVLLPQVQSSLRAQMNPQGSRRLSPYSLLVAISSNLSPILLGYKRRKMSAQRPVMRSQSNCMACFLPACPKALRKSGLASGSCRRCYLERLRNLDRLPYGTSARLPR